jgi:hypothetical protein
MPGFSMNIRSLLNVVAACLAGGMILSLPARSQTPDSSKYRVYLTITDSLTRKSAKAAWGFHPNATLGIDSDTLFGFKDHWYESDSSWQVEYPSPPLGFFEELRINNYRKKFTDNGLLFGNIHPYTGPSMVDTFIVSFNGDANSVGDSLYLYTHPQILSWPSVLRFYADSIILRDIANNGQTIAGPYVRIDMTKDSTWTYFGDTYFDPDLSIYRVDPLNKGFFMFVYHPKISPGPPVPVTLVSPPNGSTGRQLNETLQWSAAPAAFSYKVQFDTSRGFARPIVTDSGTALSKSVNGLVSNTWYYWRVLVKNPFGVSYYQNPPDSFQTLALTPLPPPIISPTPGQQNVSQSPTFKWGAGAPPLTYELQLSRSATYSPLIQDTTLSDTSCVFPAPLSNCDTYFWRVRGHNNQGFGNFSSASFTVSFAAPALPVIVQYPDGQTDVPANARLIWTGRDDCSVDYRVQVARDSLFAQLVLNTTVTDTTVVLSNLLGLTTYYWRVEAENPGFNSGYTATRSFTTALLPPTVPAPLTPPNGSTVQSFTPNLVWGQSLNNPINYRLQMDVSASFTTPIVDDSSLTDTFRTVGPLLGCTKYYWRVSAKNAIGSSQFSSTLNFTAPLQAPGAPSLLLPVDGAANQPTQLTLTWAQSGLCAPAKYVVQLALDNTFGTLLRHDTVTQTSRLVGSLTSNTTYFWRIVAINDSGSAVSLIRSFTTTSITKPPVPVLLTPPNGQGGLPTTIVLIWDTSSRANFFKLQVAYDQAFTLIAFQDSTIIQSQKQVGPLLNSTTYYWRVSARNDSGSSAYSDPWSFSTLAPPSAPALVQPADGSVDVPVTPTFVWTQPSGATFYQLQVSKDALFTNFFSNDSDLTNTSWVLGRMLASYTRYSWRVRAKNSVGWGDFSPVGSFRTTRVGAANWAIPLAISETGPGRDTAFFGISPQATFGIDPSLGEYELPPMTNNGLLDIRFVDMHSPFLVGEGLRVDYFPFTTYTQVDTFKLRFEPGAGTYPMQFSWPAGYIRQICDSLVVMDEFGGFTVHKRMDIDSTLSVSNQSISSLLLILYGAFPILDVKPVVPGIPKGFVLSQNYPNPFNPSTRVRFSTEHSAHIRITVYDLLGRDVATLADGEYFPGIYSVSWNGAGGGGGQLPSGIYYARMIAEERLIGTIKMLLLK